MDSTSLDCKMKSLSLVLDRSLQDDTGGFIKQYQTEVGEPCIERNFSNQAKYSLKEILKQHENERNDCSFSRDCLFCKKHFTGNRSSLFNHLKEDHNFHVGSPSNIVFVNELLDVLGEKLKRLECFFCEKLFKDWMALKEHMRKKQHKRINPKNKAFDKYYLINYLEPGKNWTEIQDEEDFSSEFDEDDEDEQEEVLMECEEDICWFVCLFCDDKLKDFNEMLLHMKDVHHFDYQEIKEKNQLDFYQQVKLINYIRRQVNLMRCTFCEEPFKTKAEIFQHMAQIGHSFSLLPDRSRWDQPMYYFPTYENDSFLCALDDENEEIGASEPFIVAEDQHQLEQASLFNDPNFRKTLL